MALYKVKAMGICAFLFKSIIMCDIAEAIRKVLVSGKFSI
jgi:hypothetical protein